MGGHAAGDRASDLAVRRLARIVDDAEGDAEDDAEGDEEGDEEDDPRRDASAEDRITRALTRAARDIDRLSEELGVDAGTTATGAMLEGGEHPEAVVVNVGDSRVYRFEAGRLHQVTTDHSVVQELVDAGELDADAAEYHPAANIITRALGFHEAPRPDFVRLPAAAGLRLLLCSDGLTKEVDRRHLRLLLASGLSAEVTASALVDAALAAGGRDNVSVIVVDVL
ncbi:MAG: serine/threonine-protein phosphatase [Micrococcales bacterium]|nr:serine/threonine-protein phosphatase [Micrococcales bacterium]